MRSQPVLLLAGILGLAGQAFAQERSTFNQTGSIQAYLNATTMQQLADDFSVVMPDFLARDSDFAFDLDLSNGFVYDLKVYGIKIKQLNIGHRQVKIVPGAKFPELHAELSSVDVTGHVTGGLEVGPYQMFNFTELTVTGLKLRLELGIVHDTTGKSVWQVQAASVIDFVDMYMFTDSLVLNTAFQMFHPLLVIYLKSYEGGYGAYFAQLVKEYNVLLRARSTFFLPFPDRKHHRFNATIVSPPSLDAETQVAAVQFDGTIFDSFLKTSHVDLTDKVAAAVPGFAGSQVFVHQSSLASLFYSVYDLIMPVRIDDKSSSLEIIAEFPEIKKHYGGHGTAVNMSIEVLPSSGRFLTISKDNGFEFGKGDDLYVKLDLTCSNPAANISAEPCVTFDIKLNLNMNVTVVDFDLYFMLGDVTLESVEITKDAIGMKDRDYQRVLQHIVNYAIANFNYVNQNATTLNNTSVLVPVAREFVSIHANPYVQDEFLWIGIQAKPNVTAAANSTHNATHQLYSAAEPYELPRLGAKFLSALA